MSNETTAKRFADYTDAELLGIDNETLNKAIRIEAIERGIKPPITLSEALRRSEWVGYQKPAEAIKVFRIRQGYSQTDFGWLDEAKAHAALEGIVRLEKINYNRDDLKIVSSDASIEVAWVGLGKSSEKAAKFEEYFQDDTEFNAVVEECMERYGRVRQAAYDAKVRSEKRAEYLRLASGNEGIARAFWAKTERTEFPTE